MRNILRKNLSYIWNGTNKVNENMNGGIALWDTPPAVHNAFNPAVFIRTKYLHQVEGIDLPFDVKPNYLGIDNANVELTFEYPTGSFLYISINSDTGVHDIGITKGVTAWNLSNTCSEIYSIDGIGLYQNEVDAVPVKDSKYIYLLPDTMYSDGNYICKDKDNIVFRNTEIDTASFSVKMTWHTVSVLADTYGGVAKFDVSEIIKGEFSSILADFGPVKLISDPCLYITYSTSDIGAYPTFMALHSVSQIGEATDRTQDAGKVLSRFCRLLMYEGYPLDYSVLSVENAVTTAVGETKPYTVSRVSVMDGEKVLQNEDAIDILNEDRKEIILMSPFDIRVFRSCIPDNPFYVRWINRIGGVDYFMFSRQQKVTSSVSSSKTYTPVADDTEGQRGNLKPFAVDTDYTVTVGAEVVSQCDFAALNEMPFSPMIEWWNENLHKWVRLYVKKYQGSHYSRTEARSFEVVFAMPKIMTQF